MNREISYDVMTQTNGKLRDLCIVGKARQSPGRRDAGAIEDASLSPHGSKHDVVISQRVAHGVHRLRK